MSEQHDVSGGRLVAVVEDSDHDLCRRTVAVRIEIERLVRCIVDERSSASSALAPTTKAAGLSGPATLGWSKQMKSSAPKSLILPVVPLTMAKIIPFDLFHEGRMPHRAMLRSGQVHRHRHAGRSNILLARLRGAP